MDILIICSAFLLGWWLNKIATLNRILKDPDKFIELLNKYKDVKDEADDAEVVRGIEVERHGAQLYLFCKTSGEFLAQGETLQEALDRVEKRFPNQSFKGLLSKEQADSLGISVE